MDGNVKVPLCALWANTSKGGKKYWSGMLGDAKVLVFENDKRGNDRAPDLRVYLVPNDKKRNGGGGGGGGSFGSGDEESPF